MQRAMFSCQVVLSKTKLVDNTLGKSINLLKCACHASLSFIDPFNNPIIKLISLYGFPSTATVCLTPVIRNEIHFQLYIANFDDTNFPKYFIIIA